MAKVAIVVQRYGTDVIGGAESHARQIAERLAQEIGWDVHVLTTAARDYRTWSNEYPEGIQHLNGVTIHRFRSKMGRSPLFPVFNRLLKGLLPALRRQASPLARLLEKTWIVLQGPFCPDLARYIETHAEEYDHFIFFTYLYYPTVWGYASVAHKATLVPTAHDEFPFHFSIVEDMLNRVSLLLPNTLAEATLIASKLRDARRVKVAGIGVDLGHFHPDRACEKRGVTYLGRISRGKNVDRMLAWCSAHFPELPVNLAGKAERDFRMPRSETVQHLGFVSEETKVRLLQSSRCVINPSDMESLSLIVLEAIACGVPVLVNTRCDVLRHYTEVCPTVFGFHDEESFVAALRHILATDWTNESNLRALDESRRWLEETYSWPAIMQTFQALLPPPHS